MPVALLKAWKNFSADNRGLQQFGQSDDESTYNGATGCTHACLQRLVKAKTGRKYSIDEISKIAGYPWPANNPKMRGLITPSEVQRVVDHFNLPYKLKLGLTWDEVLAATSKGPVLTGIRYGYWPEMIGAKYNGQTADGKPGGFAFRNGKTQLSGFESGYHAILVLGKRRAANGVMRVVANEPNHGSAARPEKPDWDSIRASDGGRAYRQYSSDGRTPFAWVPTTTFRPKGY